MTHVVHAFLLAHRLGPGLLPPWPVGLREEAHAATIGLENCLFLSTPFPRDGIFSSRCFIARKMITGLADTGRRVTHAPVGVIKHKDGSDSAGKTCFPGQRGAFGTFLSNVLFCICLSGLNAFLMNMDCITR